MKTELIKEPEKNSENDSFPRFYQHNVSDRIWVHIRPGRAMVIHDSTNSSSDSFRLAEGSYADNFPSSSFTRITAPFTIRFVP